MKSTNIEEFVDLTAIPGLSVLDHMINPPLRHDDLNMLTFPLSSTASISPNQL